jgi:thiosulfate/3-mercaptopyruvate sulfurtransferase
MKSISLLVLFGATATASLSAQAAESYARPELLVEPTSLAKLATARPPVILDARSRKGYDQRHLPGALWIDAGEWKKLFADGKDTDAWAKRIGQLGIGADTTIVVYDDKKGSDAARMWWILRYWGLTDVRLLNGGWKAWQKAKLPTTDKATPSPKPLTFKARAHAERLAIKSQMLAAIKSQQWQLVDSRSSKEYCGIDLHGNKRGGAMPSAKHLDWVDLVDTQTHRFKTPGELRRLFADAGIDLQRPTAAYCQSGGRASVMAFAMELMGAGEVRNYYRSWHEWGNADDTPISKPKTP